MNCRTVFFICIILCMPCLIHGQRVFFGLKFFPCAQSCKDRCNKTRGGTDLFLFLECSCDEWCVVFGDCCSDFYPECKGIVLEEDILKSMEDAQPLIEDKNQVKLLKDFSKNSTCTTINYPEQIRHVQKSILSVRSCASDYPDGDDKDKCEGRKRAFPLDIPVSVAGVPFLVFHNIYCAKCNHFPLDDKIIFWRANLQCMVDLDTTLTSVQSLTNYDPQRCISIVSPPDAVEMRYCNEKIEDRPCNPNQHSISKREVIENVDVSNSQNDSKNTNIDNRQSSSSREKRMVPLPSEELVLPLNFTFSSTTALEASADLAKQNLKILCDSYYSPGQFKNRIYKNPHCYACEEGWDVFVDTNTTSGADEIMCFFMGGGFAMSSIKNTKLVDHHFGILNNRFIYFSSDTGRLLNDNFKSCAVGRSYDILNDKCDLLNCSQGTSPYFGSCVDSSYKLKHLSPEQNNTSMFITMEATWGGQSKDFNELTMEAVRDMESLSFSTIILHPKSPLHNFTRKIDIISVRIKERGYDESVVLPSGAKAIVRHLTKLRFEIAVDVYFQDIRRVINDFAYGTWSGLYLNIEEMTLGNYRDDMACRFGVLVNYTSPNMTIVDIGPNIFVEVDGELIDLRQAWFKLKSDQDTNRNLQVQSLYVCEGFKISSSIKVLSRAAPEKQSNIAINPDEPKSLNFKVVGASLALALKSLSFILALCRRTIVKGGSYFHVLGLSSSMIDIVHLIEYAAVASTRQALSISIHFAWLFTIYSSLAWCINMVTCNTKATLKCVIRHIATSCIVPVVAIAICATGDINNPPWNIEYGMTDHIFSVGKIAFLYGYIAPVCFGVTMIILAHTYRVIRRKIFQKGKPFYACNIIITFLLVLQFCLGSSERLELGTLFYYLYFTLAIVVGWTFLAIATMGLWGEGNFRSSRSLNYMHNLNDSTTKNTDEKNIEINQ